MTLYELHTALGKMILETEQDYEVLVKDTSRPDSDGWEPICPIFNARKDYKVIENQKAELKQILLII